MAYGWIKSYTFEDQGCTAILVDPDGHTKTTVYPQSVPVHKAENLTRYGTNAPVLLKRSKRSDDRPLVQYVKRIRVRYKVAQLPSYKGKPIYRTRYTYVYKYKKGPYPKGNKRKKRLNPQALPNALKTNGSAIVYYGPYKDNNVHCSHPSGYSYHVYGSLWWNIPSLSGSIGVFEPVTFLSSGISDAYYGRVIEDIDAVLIPRLYKKVKNQDVNLAQALAEYKQTASLFVDQLTRIAKALFALKKGHLQKAARALFPPNSKALASDVLMYQYGVKPLLDDIDGAAKHLAMPEPKEYDIIVKKRVEIPRHDLSASGRLVRGALSWYESVVSFGYVEVRYKVRIRINVSDGLERELSRLGFGNLPSLAWELTPWSHVVDWVLPYGNYLNTLDAFAGATVVSAQKTVFRKEYVQWDRRYGGVAFDGWTTGDSPSSGFINTRYECVREVGIPIPELPTATLKNPFSGSHLINAIAHLVQLKGK